MTEGKQFSDRNLQDPSRGSGLRIDCHLKRFSPLLFIVSRLSALVMQREEGVWKGGHSTRRDVKEELSLAAALRDLDF